MSGVGGLSREQAAVLGLEEDTMVAAGAGAGKTTTLVASVVDDIARGLPVEGIAVCTFTRSAAALLRNRIDALLEESLPDPPATDLMWIGTIDALLARFLREGALEADLPVDFRVASERELRPLRRRALARAVEGLGDAEIEILDREIGLGSDRFLDEIEGIRRSMARLGIHSLRERIGLPANPEPALAALRDLLEASLTEKQAGAVLSDARAIDAGRPGECGASLWNIRKAELLPLRDRAAEARDLWRQSRIDELSEPLAAAAGNLARVYADELAELKGQAGMLDFDDMTETSLRLARAGNSPGWAKTYIDEAQDTDPRQNELLRLWSEGPVISIGDVNQSIYGFRQADVDAFRESSRGKARLELADNYRSRPEVLRAVNALCRPLPDLDELIEMRAAGDHKPLQIPAVEVLTTVTSGPGGAVVEAETMADEILRAAEERKIPLDRVCVLVRSNNDVGVFADAFRSRGVPTLPLQNRGLLGREESLDLLAYLRLLAFPGDEGALLRVISSPFIGLDDQTIARMGEERALDVQRIGCTPHEPGYPSLFDYLPAEADEWKREFDELLAARGQVSATGLLRQAIELHRFDLALELLDPTGARLRNVEKLLWIVDDLENDYHGPDLRLISERLEEERLYDQEGQDDRVPEGLEGIRVMTVHAAKGDEFDLVACARLSRRPGNSTSALAVSADGHLGVSLDNGEGPRLASSVMLEIRDLEREKNRAEEQRILYVAMTRAREHLLLLASTSDSKKGPTWQEPFALLPIPALPAPGSEEILELEDSHGKAKLRIRTIESRGPGEKPGEALQLRGGSSSETKLPVFSPEIPGFVGADLSYSALASWRRCSFRRHLEHDLGLRSPETAVEEQTGGARGWGIELHQILASIDWNNPEMPSEPRARRAVEQILSGPIDLGRGRWKSEQSFALILGKEMIRGRIDLVGELNGEWTVIDWKSGDDPDEIFSIDYQLQRRLYGLAVLLAPERPSRVRTISFHTQDGSLEEEILEAADIASLREDLEREIGEILGSEPRPAAERREPFCRGCPGETHFCPVAENQLTDTK